MKSLDWNLVRAFHATVAAGSLSAAAQRVGLTQPTLSRQISALEADLGVVLFDRVGRQLVLNDVGRKLYDLTETMADTAEAFALAARGQEKEIGGHVSISATDSFSQYILPQIVSRIQAEAPQISISIIATNETSDLHRGEADIAIRHAKPMRNGLVGKFIRHSDAFFYASPEWVERNGCPKSFKDLATDQLLGFANLDLYASFLNDLGVNVSGAGFRLASDSSVVIWEMVKRGMGVAPMHREIAERTPGVVRLFSNASPIRSPIWVVTHERLQANSRIQIVRDILEGMLLDLGQAAG